MTVYLMSMLRAAVLVSLAALAASAAASAQTIPTLGPLDASGRVTYFIEDGERGSTYTAGDRELATWALKAWERASNGRVRFEPSTRAEALVQIHWVPAGGGQYGEMRSIRVGDRRGAAVLHPAGYDVRSGRTLPRRRRKIRCCARRSSI